MGLVEAYRAPAEYGHRMNLPAWIRPLKAGISNAAQRKRMRRCYWRKKKHRTG